MPKIQLVSDLYLDHDGSPHNNDDLLRQIVAANADILVIAGDLAASNSANWLHALDVFCKHTKHVVYVPGNHEYYGSSPHDVEDRFDAARSLHKNLHLLTCGKCAVEGIKFAGATLWFNNSAQVQQQRGFLNDFRYIEKFEPWVYYQSVKARSLLANTVADVIVTHHLPSYYSVEDKYKGSPLNCFYVNNLMDDGTAKVRAKLWMHGHTHASVDWTYTHGDGATPGCRVLANPKGYKGENPKFNAAFALEVAA
jgi:Icc-related predicted phosphoesterase